MQACSRAEAPHRICITACSDTECAQLEPIGSSGTRSLQFTALCSLLPLNKADWLWAGIYETFPNSPPLCFFCCRCRISLRPFLNYRDSSLGLPACMGKLSFHANTGMLLLVLPLKYSGTLALIIFSHIYSRG
jgi:hypothetical protein